MIVFFGLLIALAALVAIYWKPWIGICLFLMIPIIKGYFCTFFPVLQSYSFDLCVAALTVWACLLDLKRTSTRHPAFSGGRKFVLVCYYVLLYLAVMSYPLSRADFTAYQKILMFGIFNQIVILVVVVYVRNLNNLDTLFKIVFMVALFSTFMIFFSPMSNNEISLRSTMDAVLGSNRLIPSSFCAMASIWLWSHLLEKGNWRRWFWLIPVFLLAIVSTGTRAPLIFAPFVYFVSLIIRRSGQKVLIGLGALVIFAAAGLIALQSSTLVQHGAKRFDRLDLSTNESRYVYPAMVLKEWWDRPEALVKILGGGIADSAFSISHDPDHYVYPHDWLVEILVELGPAGALTYIVLIVVVLRGIAKLYDRERLERCYSPNDRANIVASIWISFYTIVNTFKTASFSGGYNMWFFITTGVIVSYSFSYSNIKHNDSID